MKKKILFMLINMNVGGTEKALLTMLSEINNEQYDVTLLMLEEYGGFLKQIPSWVNIKYIKDFKLLKDKINNPIHINAIQLLKSKKIIQAFNMMYLYLIYKITKEKSKFYKFILKDYPVIDENYDVAVAYAGPMDFITYFVANKIRARKKVQWVHFDINKIGFNQNFAKKIYSKFDKIFVVSNEAKKALDYSIPQLSNKIEVFNNVISQNAIRKISESGEGFKDNFNGIRLLTVGRLSNEKGQDLVVEAMKYLKNDGYNVRWYSIGEGSLRSRCEELIKEYNLEEDCILLGTKTNPYKYIEECDIYIQSSRHEGYCITLAEARCFNKPIVSTNFISAKDQIINEETGLIADINAKSIYENIKKLLDDKALKDKIAENLILEDVDTTGEIEKLYRIIR